MPLTYKADNKTHFERRYWNKFPYKHSKERLDTTFYDTYKSKERDFICSSQTLKTLAGYESSCQFAWESFYRFLFLFCLSQHFLFCWSNIFSLHIIRCDIIHLDTTSIQKVTSVCLIDAISLFSILFVIYTHNSFGLENNGNSFIEVFVFFI